jgi:predicted pyridoxine 5'-phosphate oxidase superfamily flavin-nucleotide-binding protein
MASMFSDEQRQLQDRFDTRRLADRIEDLLVKDTFNDHERAFIEKRDMFFLATCDADGQPTCSYKGGDPGFVKVLDERTLAFPNYDGNGMYLSMGNVLQHAPVGMLFIDFEKQNRMRVDGDANVDLDDPMLASWPEAQFVVRVTARRVYPNCPRYIHKYSLVERSRFVPRPQADTPVPDWKRMDWACDVLPADDPARQGAGE